MGYYINPPGESKESWLEREAVETEGPVAPSAERFPVCLVDNGMFTAAAIGWCDMEMLAFADPEDIRPKRWFSVERRKLPAVSDLPESLA